MLVDGRTVFGGHILECGHFLEDFDRERVDAGGHDGNREEQRWSSMRLVTLRCVNGRNGIGSSGSSEDVSTFFATGMVENVAYTRPFVTSDRSLCTVVVL